ncbi:hypothetical protein D3C86_2248290 [compost metagenome]
MHAQTDGEENPVAKNGIEHHEDERKDERVLKRVEAALGMQRVSSFAHGAR